MRWRLAASPSWCSARRSSPTNGRAFGQHLAAYLGVDERRDRLIPALLHPCELPLDLAFRVPLDYTRESDWEAETARLRAEIGRTPPESPTEQVPLPLSGPDPLYPGAGRAVLRARRGNP